MFNLNLEEELVQRKRSSIKEQDMLAIKEATKILNGTSEEDVKTLARLGIDHSIKRKEELSRIMRLRSVLNPERIFSGNDIKTLCVRYGVRFLPVSYFKGEVDAQLPSKVKEFEAAYRNAQTVEENKSSSYRLDKDPYRRNESVNSYMICAPEESFRLTAKPRDPLMFYQIDEDSYYLVHKWGNDISSFRAVKAWMYKNVLTYFICVFTMWMIPSVLVNLFFPEFSAWGAALIFSIITLFIAGISDDGDWLTDRLWSNRYTSRHFID